MERGRPMRKRRGILGTTGKAKEALKKLKAAGKPPKPKRPPPPPAAIEKRAKTAPEPPKPVDTGPSLTAEDRYFWPDDMRSYTKEELITWFMANPLSDVTPTGIKRSQRRLHWPRCYPTMTRGSVCKFVETYMMDIKDKTASAGSTPGNPAHCAISQEPFRIPYILNLTGRTYELLYIQRAIRTSLIEADHTLHLEDGLIRPEMLGNIVLWPNRTLGCPESERPLKYPAPKVIVYVFDERRPRHRNPAFVCDFSAADINGLWNMEAAARLHGHMLPTYEERVMVRDFIIEHADPFRYHAKPFGAGRAIFNNCLFRGCIIRIDCLCGVEFQGCKFDKCHFIMSSDDNNPLSENECKGCIIRGGTLEVPGIMFPDAMEHLHTCFKNTNDIKPSH